MLQGGNSGDGCDLRKGDLFVLSWVRVRRVRRGSISSELLMCGGGVCNTSLLPLVDRYIGQIYACIWRMFVVLLLYALFNHHHLVSPGYPGPESSVPVSS